MALKNPFSRSSSRTSLNESMNQEEEDVIETLEDIGGNNDIKLFGNVDNYNNEHLLSTANDPLGSLILNISQTLNGLLIESKNKKTPKIDIEELCQLYTEKLKHDDKKGEDQIEKTAKLAENNLLEASMNYHLITPKIRAPTYFSETPTLTTVSKFKDALTVFGRSKYENNKNSHSVVEFLKLLNNSQNICKLTRSEFEQMLLRSTTGPAHKHVAAFLQAGEDIETIYLKLLTLYDHSRTPEQCREQLNNLRARKTDTLQTLCAKILELATESSRLSGEGNHIQQVVDLNATQALISALPNPPILGSPRRRVSQIFHELAARKGQLPTFTQLINRLSIYADEITDSIKLYGESLGMTRNAANKRASNFNRSDDYTKQLRNPYGITRINNLNRDGPGQRAINRGINPARALNPARPDYDPRQAANIRRTGALAGAKSPTKYCTLCGGNNHFSYELCYAMKQNGRPVLVQPTQAPCGVCLKKTGKKLYHPLRFCFNNNDSNTRGTPQGSTQNRVMVANRSANGRFRRNQNKGMKKGGN